MSFQADHKQKFDDLKIALHIDNRPQLKRDANGGNTILFVYPPDEEDRYIKKARELCDKYNSLLIFDEVQTGIGRTGKLFGYEHLLPVEPDIITLAKGLGGGLPIGALLIKEKYSDLLKPGEHASTFGGNPVCSAAANAVLDTIEKDDLLNNTEKMGIYFREQLESLKKDFSIIKEVRGMGLLNGIEVDANAKDIINKMMENKIITVPAGTNVVRFIPPLTVEKEHIDITIDTLKKVLKDH